MKHLINKLYTTHALEKHEWAALLSEHQNQKLAEYLFSMAQKVQQEHYRNHVYIRGLIEFTNYCKNNCYYCGIQRSNRNITRYRLSKQSILDCCAAGYDLGFRTFVLQGGEDGTFTDSVLCDIVSAIKNAHPDCAVTLSVGERTKESYQQLFDAGADRYLLRHETYDHRHYASLHPQELTAKNRQQCLWNLKEIGYQVGTGFMVGSPGQTYDNLADDMLFLKGLNPQMVGIGPFIPHCDTIFRDEKAGTLELTLFLLGLIRLMLPKVLLPATTALGTIHPNGREQGILAGANVIMPNLSPADLRKNYSLYDNKISSGAEAAEGLQDLKNRISKIGYEIVIDRGDSLNK